MVRLEEGKREGQIRARRRAKASGLYLVGLGEPQEVFRLGKKWSYFH